MQLRFCVGSVFLLIALVLTAASAAGQDSPELSYFDEPTEIRKQFVSADGSELSLYQYPFQGNILLGRDANWTQEVIETGQRTKYLYLDKGADYLHEAGNFSWLLGTPITLTYYPNTEPSLIEGTQPFDGNPLQNGLAYYNPYLTWWGWYPIPYYGGTQTSLVEQLPEMQLPASETCPAVTFEDVAVLDQWRFYCPEITSYRPSFCPDPDVLSERNWYAKGYGLLRRDVTRSGQKGTNSFMLRSTALDDGSRPACPPRLKLDVEYNSNSSADRSLRMLDVYAPSEATNMPVVIFVHGGGWQTGDKRELWQIPSFVSFFQQERLVLVSVNFRLINNALSPGATYADQAADIAKAVRWVHDNIAEFGGDKDNIFLLGHSSGAHLAALLGTDEHYLLREGLSLQSLRGFISMDVMAYDIPFAIANAAALGYPQATTSLPKLFGNGLQQQRAASPINYVAPGKAFPPSLIIWAPLKDGIYQQLSHVESDMMTAALQAAGAKSETYGALKEDHSSLITNFGEHTDLPTQEVREFIRQNVVGRDDLYIRQEINSIVSPLIDSSGRDSRKAVGLVAVALTPQQTIISGYGLTAIGSGEIPDAHSYFHLASVSKAFTGLMLAQAVVDGRAGINAAANSYLNPDLRLPNYYRQEVTMGQLISHFGGLESLPSNLMDRDGNGRTDPGLLYWSPATGYTRANLNSYLRGTPFLSAPGRDYYYSNTGIALAAQALQDRLGYADYQQMFDAELVAELNLRETGLADHLLSQTSGRAVSGYSYDAWGRRTEISYPQGGAMAGSGYLLSTGSDMARFLAAAAGIYSTPLDAAFAEAIRPLGTIRPGMESAYGLNVVNDNGKIIYAKLGSNYGFSTYIAFSREKKLAVALMANNGSSSVENALITAGDEILDVLRAYGG